MNRPNYLKQKSCSSITERPAPTRYLLLTSCSELLGTARPDGALPRCLRRPNLIMDGGHCSLIGWAQMGPELLAGGRREMGLVVLWEASGVGCVWQRMDTARGSWGGVSVGWCWGDPMAGGRAGDLKMREDRRTLLYNEMWWIQDFKTVQAGRCKVCKLINSYLRRE